MQKGDVTGAWTKAKDLLQANPTSAPVQGFLKDVEVQRTQQAKDAVEKAIKDAKALLLARQGSAASLKLQTVILLVPAAPPPVQKAFEAMQREIKAGTSQQHINADMNKTIVQGSAGASTGSGAAAAAAPAMQRTMVQPMVAPAKPFPMKQVVGAVLAVALVVGGFFGYKVITAPLPLDSFVEINATPWAKVTNIVSKDGKHTYPVNQETPIRVLLPSGDYTVNATDPDGKPMSQAIQVNKSAPGSVSLVVEAVSANEIVQSSN
jgi:hypothetical protein